MSSTTLKRTGVAITAGVLVLVAGAPSASAKESGTDATVSGSRSETMGFSRPISSSSRYGHLQFGNWGYKMGVKKYYVNSACNVTSSYVGTVNKMPSANTWGYHYWETAT